MSCFKKTSNGNIEMIIFTIAKQFWQPMLANKSKKWHLTTDDTFTELIITIYSPRRVTAVNPLHKVKFFT